jgi:4-amino-4-deoxy-L-arabinose transferase-like glycosyltransferase
MNLKNILIFLFFVLIVFLRFYQVPQRFIFDIDTEYQAFLAKTIIKDFHIIWVGVSAGSIGYYLGPGLVYLTAFLLFISKGDPLSLAYFSALVGTVTLLSLFFVTKKIFGNKVAYIAGVFYGFSAFIIYYDRKYWPIFIPLVGIWLFYSLIKARKDTLWLILSAVLIGISFHVHLTLLIFFVPFFYTVFRKRKKIKSGTWILISFSYLVTTSPLLVFDFVHNFDNLLTPLKFIKNIGQTPGSFNPHLNPFLFGLNKIVFIDIPKYRFANIIITLFSILIMAKLTVAKKNYPGKLLFAIVALFSFLFCLYPGKIQEYYLVLLFPFWSMAAGLLLKKLKKNYLCILLSVFILTNLYSYFSQDNPHGLSTKKKFVEETSRRLNEDYYLSFGSDVDYEGWRYLFETYGKKPARSQADGMFGWTYHDEISKTPPIYKLVIFSKQGVYKANIYR